MLTPTQKEVNIPQGKGVKLGEIGFSKFFTKVFLVLVYIFFFFFCYSRSNDLENSYERFESVA